jgi:hypothetical protein
VENAEPALENPGVQVPIRRHGVYVVVNETNTTTVYQYSHVSAQHFSRILLFFSTLKVKPFRSRVVAIIMFGLAGGINASKP